MDESAGAFPLLELPAGLLDRVVGSLELWDLAAARAACGALRAAAGRRARRLAFSLASLQCESGGGDQFVQVRGLLRRGVGGEAPHLHCRLSPPQACLAQSPTPARFAEALPHGLPAVPQRP
jgi:hypothetical protein